MSSSLCIQATIYRQERYFPRDYLARKKTRSVLQILPAANGLPDQAFERKKIVGEKPLNYF